MTDDHEIRKGNRYALIGLIVTIVSIFLTIFVKAIIEVYSTSAKVVALEKRIDMQTARQDSEIQIIRDDVKQILLRDQPK